MAISIICYVKSICLISLRSNSIPLSKIVGIIFYSRLWDVTYWTLMLSWVSVGLKNVFKSLNLHKLNPFKWS